jgi:hypothetical protein
MTNEGWSDARSGVRTAHRLMFRVERELWPPHRSAATFDRGAPRALGSKRGAPAAARAPQRTAARRRSGRTDFEIWA